MALQEKISLRDGGSESLPSINKVDYAVTPGDNREVVDFKRQSEEPLNLSQGNAESGDTPFYQSRQVWPRAAPNLFTVIPTYPEVSEQPGSITKRSSHGEPIAGGKPKHFLSDSDLYSFKIDSGMQLPTVEPLSTESPKERTEEGPRQDGPRPSLGYTNLLKPWQPLPWTGGPPLWPSDTRFLPSNNHSRQLSFDIPLLNSGFFPNDAIHKKGYDHAKTTRHVNFGFNNIDPMLNLKKGMLSSWLLLRQEANPLPLSTPSNIMFPGSKTQEPRLATDASLSHLPKKRPRLLAPKDSPSTGELKVTLPAIVKKMKRQRKQARKPLRILQSLDKHTHFDKNSQESKCLTGEQGKVGNVLQERDRNDENTRRHVKSRKPLRSIRSAEKCDPNFRGAVVCLKIQVKDENAYLDISAHFCNVKSYSSSGLHWKKRHGSGSLASMQEPCHTSDEDILHRELFYPNENYSKVCASCSTKRTPLWRDAEDGTPLCNACGIRFKKYRVRCSKCWHIPKKDIKTYPNCPSCGSALRVSFSRRGLW